MPGLGPERLGRERSVPGFGVRCAPGRRQGRGGAGLPSPLGVREAQPEPEGRAAHCACVGGGWWRSSQPTRFRSARSLRGFAVFSLKERLGSAFSLLLIAVYCWREHCGPAPSRPALRKARQGVTGTCC